MIDKVRYYLALVMLAAIPPAFLFWFSIHPFIRFWRRMGVRLTLVIHYTVMIAMMVLTILYAEPLLSVQFGTSPVLIGLAIPILVLSGVLRRRLWNYLRPKVLMGVPELAPEHAHHRGHIQPYQASALRAVLSCRPGLGTVLQLPGSIPVSSGAGSDDVLPRPYRGA